MQRRPFQTGGNGCAKSTRHRLPRIYELLEQYRENRTIFVFHSRKEADDWLCNWASALERQQIPNISKP